MRPKTPQRPAPGGDSPPATSEDPLEAGVAVAMVGADGALLYASSGFARIAGRPLGPGDDLHALFAAADARRRFAECLERPGSCVSFDCRVVARDGHSHAMRAVAENRLDDPRLRAVVVAVRDETPGRPLEADPDRRLARLSALLDAAVVLGTTRTAGDALQVAAEQAKRIVGARQAVVDLASAAEHPAGSHEPAWSLSSVTGFGEIRLSAAELDSHPDWEELRRRAPGRPPLRGCLAVPLLGPGGALLGAIELSDKIDGEFGEEDLEILRRLAALVSAHLAIVHTLERSEAAIEERRRILSTISHDLRNPLNAIQITASLLDLPGGDDERRARHVASIRRSAEQMTVLIQRLLETRETTPGGG